MVNFDVVSPFSGVPIKGTVSLLSRHFEEDILRPFRHVLTSSCFGFVGEIYKLPLWLWSHQYLQSSPTSLWRFSRRRRSTGLPIRSYAGSVTWTTLCVIWPNELDRRNNYGPQVNYVPSFQTLSAIRHVYSSAKFVCASQPAVHRLPWSAELEKRSTK
jgi:hypothetical protein